ncbi:MAG: polymer-forming cytoskeletal protein, partial [Rhodospirillaceae bacterium]|nr:polymer-forming cytoskeletal protein [Rhodospirillaceae bacterium]
SFEGDLKVKKRLFIRASGRVNGTVRYGQLEIERGGRIEGKAQYDPADREADLQPVAMPQAVEEQAEAMEGSDAGGGRPSASPLELPSVAASSKLRAD